MRNTIVYYDKVDFTIQ